jgi:hypothetical protein
MGAALLPADAFAKNQKITRIDCTFEEPFFKTYYNLATKNMIVHDLTMETKDVHSGIKIVKVSSGQVQLQFSNGVVFQTLSYVGNGTNGKSLQSRLFRVVWPAYNYGPAPIGECHTL